MPIEPSTTDNGTAEAAYDRLQAALRTHREGRAVLLSAYRRTATTAPAPVSTPRESVRRLGEALRTFGRELRGHVGAWLRDHRLGYVERANFAGYVDGYADGIGDAGVCASPRRSA